MARKQQKYYKLVLVFAEIKKKRGFFQNLRSQFFQKTVFRFTMRDSEKKSVFQKTLRHALRNEKLFSGKQYLIL